MLCCIILFYTIIDYTDGMPYMYEYVDIYIYVYIYV